MSQREQLAIAAFAAFTALDLAAIAWAIRRLLAEAHRRRHPVPGLPVDGEPLEAWERAAFLDIDRGWKLRSRA